MSEFLRHPSKEQEEVEGAVKVTGKAAEMMDNVLKFQPYKTDSYRVSL